MSQAEETVNQGSEVRNSNEAFGELKGDPNGRSAGSKLGGEVLEKRLEGGAASRSQSPRALLATFSFSGWSLEFVPGWSSEYSGFTFYFLERVLMHIFPEHTTLFFFYIIEEM